MKPMLTTPPKARWAQSVAVVLSSAIIGLNALPSLAFAQDTTHAVSRQAVLLGAARWGSVNLADATTNVNPTHSIVWTLPTLDGVFHHPAARPAFVIAVSTNAGTTLYSSQHPSVIVNATAHTVTWTPPTTTVRGVTTSVLGRYTTDSVALLALPSGDHLSPTQRQTLTQTGMLALPGQQLSPLLWPQKTDPHAMRGEIAAIHGSTLTLFGGQTVTVPATAQVHGLGQDQATLSNLRLGQFVHITQDGRGPMQIQVATEPRLIDTVFTTGSAVGEPVHWAAQTTQIKPSVLTGDTVSVTASDSYGDPATTGTFTVTGTATSLSSTFQATDGTIQAGRGSSAITDHQAQRVAFTVRTAGPYGRDHQTISAGSAAFQPGPAAHMTLTGAGRMQAGTVQGDGGQVTDIYGNPVLPTRVLLQATAGAILSPVTTDGGVYHTTYTAPGRIVEPTPGVGQTVTLSGHSATGTATATRIVTINPGPVAHLSVGSVAPVVAGGTTTLRGTATDSYGNLVLNGTPITVTGSGGIASSTVKTAAGQFRVPFTAPATPGTYSVTVQAGGTSATAHVQVTAPIPSGAVIVWGTPVSATTGVTTVTGTLKSASGAPVADALVQLRTSHGTLTNTWVVTNATGGFQAVWTPTAGSSTVSTLSAVGLTTTGGTTTGSIGIDPLVYGNQPWTDTGIAVQAGQVVTITSTGSWANVLYAKVGSAGTPVLVGANGTFVAGTSGILYLGTNGSAQSGTVDALVRVGGVSGMVPTLDFVAHSPTVAPNGTDTLSGQLMMGTTPVAGASMTLATSAGTLNDPAPQVTVVTDGQGRFTATFNAPSSGSATVTATYAPPTSRTIQQTATIQVTQAVSSPVLTLSAGAQSLTVDSGSTARISGQLMQSGQPVAQMPIALTASDGTLSATTVTTNSQGSFFATYTAGMSAGPAVITAQAAGVRVSTTIQLVSPTSTPVISGAMQLPVFAPAMWLEPGWTLSGPTYNYAAGSFGSPTIDGAWTNLSGWGSSNGVATYHFTVPVGQTQTLVYGIPAGGFQNNDPATILVNGQVVAVVNKDLGPGGSTTADNQLLWSQTFPAGTYSLTLRPGGSGIGINVYGLWVVPSTGAASTASSSTPHITGVQFTNVGSGMQMIVSGTGFGTPSRALPYIGDVGTFKFSDSSEIYPTYAVTGWNAGYTSSAEQDVVTLHYTQWTPNQITIAGFGPAYGDYGAWIVKSGDTVHVWVQNPQSGQSATWTGTLPE